MKSLLAFYVLFFALSFCGLSEKIQERLDQVQEKTEEVAKKEAGSGESKPEERTGEIEKPELTPAQQSVLDQGSEVKWDYQGIAFTLPKAWKEMNLKKAMFNYGSPNTGFLIATIATMPANFPSETSLDATYTSALEQLKNGKYESVRWLEIDGVKGVEWIEVMPEDKGDPRRHQWIGFRNYQGENQQLNVMVTTKGSRFDEKKNEFAAILYSMKIDK